MGFLEELTGVSSSANEQSRLDGHGQRRKRIKLESGERGPSRALIDYSDPEVFRDVMDTARRSEYGSVTPAMHDMYAHQLKYLCMIGFLQRDHTVLAETLEMGLEKKSPEKKKVQIPSDVSPVVILDSDDEEEKDRAKIVPVFEKLQLPSSSLPLPEDMLLKQQEELLSEKSLVCKLRGGKVRKEKEGQVHNEKESQVCNEMEDQVGNEEEDQMHNEKENEVDAIKTDNLMVVDDDLSAYETSESENDVEDDGLGDIWNQMGVAVEMFKDDPVNHSPTESSEEDEPDCDHSYVLKDDIGYVCRVCGVISREIQSIIEVQYKKNNRSRTYQRSRGHKDGDDECPDEKIKVSGHVISLNEDILAHPRHLKQMKAHQLEGFNFLKCNLLPSKKSENPGGCILAHAPGSGKTFMIISFMQSFLAKCPEGRPLVILPKGILSTWKKEFQRWQIEDTLLLDFYSTKADNRSQQLEILKQWKDNKSILFLGYNSFSRIMTDSSHSVASASCQEILINLPSIMILDEGHTPRNENTDVLHSLAKVKTPRKVVLSGTLYQNHVKEVFNILNLVRPKFLKLESSKEIRKRLMSSVMISGVRKQLKGHGESAFYDVVEYALQEDEDQKRKEMVIRELRSMTSKVLHYYKGDFLDELPGLVDFTVLLKLTPKQKHEVDKLKKAERRIFKRLSLGCAIYMHPILKKFSDNNTVPGEKGISVSDDKIDEMIGWIDIHEGVKAKFFMTILNFCEAAEEKLLVFSQYLLPLKFLERLAAWKKGWSVGKEMFMISGESTPDQREISMDRFNNSPEARIFFGSIKACGEGISLVGASRIIILDIHLNPSVSRQAIGRAFRPGQVKKVFVYRLVAADSPEEDDHLTCFKKELIAKRWFESDAYRGLQDFEMEEVDLHDSGDMFFESPHVAGDVKSLHKR